MKATAAMLCWNPDSGNVAVVEWPDTRDISYPFSMTALACWAAFHKLTDDQRLAKLFIEAMHLIVRDGMAPHLVHAAMLKIDEYRAACADDMPGL